MNEDTRPRHEAALCVDGEHGTITLLCVDGTRITVRPGKTKRVKVDARGRFHLLDCTCPMCSPHNPPDDTGERKT